MDIKDEPNDDDYVDFTWEQSPVTGEELNEDVGENSTTGNIDLCCDECYYKFLFHLTVM